MNEKRVALPLMLIVFLVLLAIPGLASASGITIYKDGDKYVKVGGRIQVQYHLEDEETAAAGDMTTDDLLFRRLRPYVEGSLYKNWKGKFQIDLGGAVDGNEIQINDAYMEYSGLN
ncbi:MAG: hypothetical protein V3T30_01800, partial [Thermodesulfobacteriota bacterium]